MYMIRGAGVVRRRGSMLALVVAATTAPDASASVIPQQTTAEARSRCSTCLARRDTLRERQEKLLMRIDSLKYEFEHERLTDARRDRLTTELRRTIYALQESMEHAHRGNALAMAQRGAEEARAVLRAMPEIAIAMKAPGQTKGYLGVVFEGTSRDFWRDKERIVQFYTYPRIAFVEPSSPAEKAGIEQGDTLLALNGNDVREREISLTRLLIPDHKLLVRVRRAGDERDLKVIVGETPAYLASRAPRNALPPETARPPASAPTIWPGDVPRSPIAPAPPTEAAMSVPPPPRSVWVFQEGVAGARVESVSEGLGRALGVRAGILVIRAAPGTPAFESGLRDGDVIVRAAGKSVNTVRELRGVLEQEGGGEYSGVKLVIVRERRQRDVTLRW